ncbi:pentapeptide repeat-containing protein [Umezawaea endophytica]|uniref:Pentapeptide repeat-containing protein n=1 Tax=Umezawaea endophytica TaxID=1654476 RepID=A0A9X2VWV1_9PSEU|nr:pentapeptide repeat-containing protein [Umezawaea endophytica]MCS7484129.1 pentapeptide repeat-containing protein [Umezawaea endophytica]
MAVSDVAQPVNPATRVHEKRTALPQWTVPLVAFGVTAASLLVFIILWRWVNGLRLQGKDLASAQLDVVKVASGIAVGGGGLFALYLAARRQRTQELELDIRRDELRNRESELAQRDRVQVHAEQVAENSRLHAERTTAAAEKDAADRRVTELYAKSVENLGSDKAPVRLGVLYALERLAQDNPAQRQTIIDVLCAYLRMPYDPPYEPANLPSPGDVDMLTLERHTKMIAEQRERVQEREVRLTAQRILASHLRPDLDDSTGKSTNLRFWPGIQRLDLTGATLIEFDLRGCHIGSAGFTGATFVGTAGFGGAVFTGIARFNEATFASNAWFTGTKFAGTAGFNKVTFTGDAGFNKAIFANTAGFNESNFTTNVWFTGAAFAGTAGFSGATFTGTSEFGNSTFSSTAEFNKTTFTGNTQFGRAMFNDVSFGRATFSGTAGFGGSNFDGITKFNDASFKGTAGFTGSVFVGAALFDNANFGRNAWFDKTIFNGAAQFDGAVFNGDSGFLNLSTEPDSQQSMSPPPSPTPPAVGPCTCRKPHPCR